MSLLRRLATLFRAKANTALDRAEDPREMLDYSYERQLELVQQVRRGLADVATSRKRVELQLTQLQRSSAKLQGQAQQALAAGREDLAREALTRRAAVTSQIGDLQGQQASLQAEEDKLTVASQRLQAAGGEGGCVPTSLAGWRSWPDRTSGASRPGSTKAWPVVLPGLDPGLQSRGG